MRGGSETAQRGPTSLNTATAIGTLFEPWLPTMQPPVFYRSVDPVENLRIRIIVKQIKGRSAPVAGGTADGASGVGVPTEGSIVTETTRMGASGAPTLPPISEELYDRTFEWQKKVFSPK
jgi:hypothetical protein